MNTSSSEPQRAPNLTEKRVLNKSCVPCRERKVKCDAAVIGLPCSSCISRQCENVCLVPVRKSRTRKVIHVLPIPSQTTVIPATSNSRQSDRLDKHEKSKIQLKRSKKSTQLSTPDRFNRKSPRQTEPDLFYLNILNDAVKETTGSSRHHTIPSTHYRSNLEEGSTRQNWAWAKLPKLDDIDNDYLVKKGVFDLPAPRHLNILIKTYFDHAYPFTPLLNRIDFIRGYQSGSCSLFLLHVILTLASLHAPSDVLSACGFANRSAAQESFFSKANLLHDFTAEDDPLFMLQGSIMLCTVIRDHPSDRDFGYWFHNAIRLATKLDLRNMCVREDISHEVLKLYRRIWWALYSLDVFHVSINTRRSRLLPSASTIKLRTEDGCEAEDVSEASSSLLSPLTPQQKVLPVVHCELSQIFGQCLSIVTNKSQQDPRQIMHPLDAWRKSLATKMLVGENTGTDVYYLHCQALSYRFECILCRLIRRCWKQSQHADWGEWAKQRLRSAILELDTITMRVLATGTLEDFPVSFVTTIIALLALHIESALDPAETDLVRSMARVSISQAMLLLTQGREIPALRRALPVFEEILAKKNLYCLTPNISVQEGGPAPQSQSQNNSMADEYALLQTQGSVFPSQFEQYGDDSSLYGNFLGLDFLDDWSLGIGELDFTPG